MNGLKATLSTKGLNSDNPPGRYENLGQECNCV